jgi:hypothetical protein
MPIAHLLLSTTPHVRPHAPHHTTPPNTLQHARSLTDTTTHGQPTADAFPLWLVAYKRIFDTTQMQANVIGIALYLSVCMLGIPLSPVVLVSGLPCLVTQTPSKCPCMHPADYIGPQHMF